MRQLSPLAQTIKQQHLTYLSDKKLQHLEQCLEQINQNQTQGDIIEAGIALGGSAILLARLMPPTAEFHGYDVFGMIPPPSPRDDPKSHPRYQIIAQGASPGLGGHRYYGYEPNLYQKVLDHFQAFGLPPNSPRLHLHPGYFEDTLTFRPDQHIALAHIDCDWYDSVKTCLERIYPALSPGGYLVLDDYYDYGGCRQATDEFLAKHSDLQIILRQENLVLQKSSPNDTPTNQVIF
jgi:asparagine synthase (glutamine-hydrolysing)